MGRTEAAPGLVQDFVGVLSSRNEFEARDGLSLCWALWFQAEFFSPAKITTGFGVIFWCKLVYLQRWCKNCPGVEEITKKLDFLTVPGSFFSHLILKFPFRFSLCCASAHPESSPEPTHLCCSHFLCSLFNRELLVVSPQPQFLISTPAFSARKAENKEHGGQRLCSGVVHKGSVGHCCFLALFWDLFYLDCASLGFFCPGEQQG